MTDEVTLLARDIIAGRSGADRATLRRWRRKDAEVRTVAKQAQRRATVAERNPLLTAAEKHEAVTVAASLLLLVAALDLADDPELMAMVSA